MNKWMKYTGIYFMIHAIGYSLLKFTDASVFSLGFFIVGNSLYYFANMLRKDS